MPNDGKENIICNHSCITEASFRLIVQECLKENNKDMKEFCDDNIEKKLDKHKLAEIHITKEEKGLIYDATNYIENSGKKTATLKWLITLPVVGLLAERIINYIVHKHP